MTLKGIMNILISRGRARLVEERGYSEIAERYVRICKGKKQEVCGVKGKNPHVRGVKGKNPQLNRNTLPFSRERD